MHKEQHWKVLDYLNFINFIKLITFFFMAKWIYFANHWSMERCWVAQTLQAWVSYCFRLSFGVNMDWTFCESLKTLNAVIIECCDLDPDMCDFDPDMTQLAVKEKLFCFSAKSYMGNHNITMPNRLWWITILQRLHKLNGKLEWQEAMKLKNMTSKLWYAKKLFKPEETCMWL